MIRVSTTEERGTWTWIVFLVLSAGLHGAVYGVETRAPDSARSSHGPMLASIVIKEPPPPPPLLPERNPPPPQKRIRPEVRPRPRRRVKRRPRPAPGPETPAKPLFGVTRGSVVAGESGVAVQVGETLEAEQEPRPAPPGPAPAPPPPPPPSRRPRPVPVYRLTRPPTFISKVAPRFPGRARREGIEGTVLLEVLVDEKGRISRVKVLRTPAPELAEAAVTAVRRSTLSPGLVGTRPVPVKLKIPYRFVLDG